MQVQGGHLHALLVHRRLHERAVTWNDVCMLEENCRCAGRFWDGVYVLYTYTAKRSTSQGVQKLLSKPAIGGESNILRHMTFVR